MRFSLIPMLLLTAAAPAAAAPDAATLAAARDLVTQLDVRGQIVGSMMRGVAEMRSGAVVTRMLESQPGFAMARSKQPAKFDEVLKKIGGMQAAATEKVVTAQAPAVTQAAVQAYAANYTAAELRQLSAFYKSPLGQALITKQPLIAAQVNTAQGQLMGVQIQQAMQALGPQIQAELKRLAPPPPAAAKP